MGALSMTSTTLSCKLVETEFSCVDMAWNNLRDSRGFSVQCDMFAQMSKFHTIMQKILKISR
jgi:hypothetical protein